MPSTAENGQAFTASGYVFEGPTPQPGVTVTIYQGGTSKGTALTNSSGYYSKSITINETGTFPFLSNALGTYSNVDYITITEPAPEPPVVDGHITIVYYWIEGMAGWENLETYPTPAKVGDDVHLAVYWRNDGSAPAVGHVIAQLTAPSYEYYVPEAVLNQDRSATPGNGWGVQFAPVTINESGSWTFLGRLDLDDVDWIDYKQIPFAVEEVAVGIPTTTTMSAPDKVGLDEKFNISGLLYETESGIPIPTMPINHSYDGRSLGSSTTGVDGDYLKEVSIPESGVWTLRSDFLGTETLQASRSEAEAVVAASPLEAAIALIASAAASIATIMYCLS